MIKHTFHITSRTNNQTWFDINMNTCWNIFADFIYYASIRYDLEIHAFVLMSNHYHILLSGKSSNVSNGIKRALTEIAKAINDERNTKNHVFGNKIKKSLILNERYFYTVLHYIYQNPVRAGICKKVEEYKYSSLAVLIGQQTLPFKVNSHPALPSDYQKNPFLIINDCNNFLSETMSKHIKLGIKKTKFKITSHFRETNEYRQNIITQRFGKSQPSTFKNLFNG